MPQTIASRALPFFHDAELNEINGGRVLFVSYDFTASIASIDSKINLADCGLFTWQSVYIDNSANANPLSLFIRPNNQLIKVAARWQGYFRVLGTSLDIDVTVSTTAAVVSVPIHFINLRTDLHSWVAQ